jgi:hypothetical protein
MNIVYRGPSIDASYQVSVHLAKRFQRRRFFFKSANQKQVLTVMAMFVNGSRQNVQSLENLAKGNMSFCHHLVSVVCHPFTFHILIFSSKNPQPNELKFGRKHLWKVLCKECTFWTFHRCFPPSFSSFGQALSEEKIFKNRPIRNKNCLWWPCLVMDHNKMCTLYRGSIYGRSSIMIAHYVPIG